jgi:hypothetical protein
MRFLRNDIYRTKFPAFAEDELEVITSAETDEKVDCMESSGENATFNCKTRAQRKSSIRKVHIQGLYR